MGSTVEVGTFGDRVILRVRIGVHVFEGEQHAGPKVHTLIVHGGRRGSVTTTSTAALPCKCVAHLGGGCEGMFGDWGIHV